MGVLGTISEALANNVAKRDRLKKFILLLMLEWEDFESHLDLTDSFFQECLAELQCREIHLSSVKESVSQSSKEMDLIRESLEQRFKEVVKKEEEFHLFQEKGSKELKLQGKRISMILEEVEVREEKLNVQEKLIQGLFEKIELEQKQFEVIGGLVGERINEIGLKENQIDKRVNELDLKEEKLRHRENEIELREKILDLKKKEFELRENGLDSEAKDGLQLNEERNLALSDLIKELLAAPEKLAAHHGQSVVGNENESPIDSSIDSISINQPCCRFRDARNEYFINDQNEDFFCKNCSKLFMAYANKLSYEVYDCIKRLKLNTGTESNADASGDARSKENDGIVNVVCVEEGEFGKPGVDDTQPRESRKVINIGRKRGSTETEVEVIVAEKTLGVDDYHCSRSSTKLVPLNSKNERLSGAGDIESSSKRLRSSKPCCCYEEEQDKATCHTCSGCGNLIGFSAEVNSSKARMEYRENAPTEGRWPICAGEFEAIEVSGSDSGYANDSNLGIIHHAGPKLNDFDKDRAEECFSADQVWACYDNTLDAMPRFYAHVRKVYSQEFKLHITWLVPDPEYLGRIGWVKDSLPVACGKFTHGDSEDTTGMSIFSHQVNYNQGMDEHSYQIYPRKGEIWAVFKDWDMEWNSYSETHSMYWYEFVEVVTDFHDSTGIRVSYLDKIKGYLSLFQRRIGGNSFLIPPNELVRFSHQVPSYKMNGTEGVPEGSFELDPASIPNDLDICC